MEERSTQFWQNRVERCETEAELKELLEENQKSWESWSDVIRPILLDKGLQVEDLQRGCGVKRSTARDFLHKIPAKREYVIMIALMAGLTHDETDRLLTRYAKYQRLYPRCAPDVIWIYLIGKGETHCPCVLFNAYYAVYERLHAEYLKNKSSSGPAGNTVLAMDMVRQAAADSSCRQAEQDDEFAALMRKMMPQFEGAYNRLIQRIEGYFTLETARTPNELYQGNHAAVLRYYSNINRLKQEHRMPSRAFLLALGVRMGLTTDSLNDLLECAGMGPLCPKDRLECAMIFFLESAYLNFPDLFSCIAAMQPGDEYDVLSSRAAVQEEQQDDSVMDRALWMVQTGQLEDTREYLIECMRYTDVFSKEERERIEKFLQKI